MSDKRKMVEMRQVRAGDRIFNTHASHPAADWLEVRRVIIDEGGMIGLHTGTYTKWGQPWEPIIVMRDGVDLIEMTEHILGVGRYRR